MHESMHKCTHVYTHTCKHAYIHTYIHRPTYIHTYIHTHTCIHTYIHIGELTYIVYINIMHNYGENRQSMTCVILKDHLLCLAIGLRPYAGIVCLGLSVPSPPSPPPPALSLAFGICNCCRLIPPPPHLGVVFR